MRGVNENRSSLSAANKIHFKFGLYKRTLNLSYHKVLPCCLQIELRPGIESFFPQGTDDQPSVRAELAVTRNSEIRMIWRIITDSSLPCYIASSLACTVVYLLQGWNCQPMWPPYVSLVTSFLIAASLRMHFSGDFYWAFDMSIKPCLVNLPCENAHISCQIAFQNRVHFMPEFLSSWLLTSKIS